ncbi:ethanolamine utilization cob(I)yrinic acid a,c-diamide adenosyltransferase EutT [Neisseria sp. Ec49-e6-T10]|uniref:ethanolamine utilization cob(I)yrinic acid a,c-diamide adenosyltransferase EutT n=1 Tax=Neisseria sp. Ec49-e6-T10 TaxID=3140744 RepID=UPI003EB6AF38
MGPYITENWLRERFSLGHGTELHLPLDSRLTPAAQGLLDDRKIIIKYVDEEGRTFLKNENAENQLVAAKDKETVALKQVNPLTSTDEWELGSCLLCHQSVQKKPETLTHIDFHNLVSKNDPRLKFRGKLDSVIAQAVLVQTELDSKHGFSAQLMHYLSDVRSALGNVLKAEATGEEMLSISLGDLTDEMIHKLSHNPLKYLGHDHLMPDVAQGVQVARLNVLRAQIREAELYAADIYITRDYKVTRPDIMQALNRLSSAVYVLMILTYLATQGKTINLENIRT